MKLKLAKRMHKARSRELDRARAALARVETQIRVLEQKLEHTRNEVRALHASSGIKSSELELGHLRCEQLEQELQTQELQRTQARAHLLDRYHHAQRGEKVLEHALTEHQQEFLKQEQRCSDDQSPEHRKKLA